jgi:hypothetical protein
MRFFFSHNRRRISSCFKLATMAPSNVKKRRGKNTDFFESHFFDTGKYYEVNGKVYDAVPLLQCRYCKANFEKLQTALREKDQSTFGVELEPEPAAPKELRKELTLCENHLKGCCHYIEAESQQPLRQQQLAFFGQTANPTFPAQTTAIAATSPSAVTLVQQYKESASEAKKELEQMKVAYDLLKKKLRKCQDKLHVNEMFSNHDKTQIENLEKEKAQLVEINQMLKGNSDDESTNDREIEDL